MRSMLILLAGCLPLAVLTVRSFVELGSIDEQLGSPNPGQNVEVDAALPASLRAEAQGEKPVVDALAEVDLLSGEALPGIEQLAEPSRFQSLRDDWPKWTAAREMVAEMLQIERATLSISTEQLDRIPLEEYDAARRQLDESKRKCEDSRQKYDQLRQRHQKSSARGTAQFLALLDRRIAELDGRIAQCDQRLEAAELLRDARAAFRPGEYGECVTLCDKLFGEYSSVLALPVASKTRVLRDRAHFWDDAERLFAQLDGALPADRQRLLEDFLTSHGDRASFTSEQRQVVQRCEERLREVKIQLEAERANRAAEAAIRNLDPNLPPEFNLRLKRIIQIVDSYPTDTVKKTLRASAKQWLRELLPEKRIAESPDLQEAETIRHEIIRGYFADVKGADGTLFGYKRYPTKAALADPDFDVGTYRKEEFLVPPGESIPRRCVRQYNQARDRLVEDPSRRAAWVELGELCESLGAELGSYRKKNGASQDDADLSFAQEARFVREFLAGSGWADIQTLFGP